MSNLDEKSKNLLDTYEDIANVYDKFYSKTSLQYKNDVENILRIHNNNFSINSWILDFGCGTGRHAEFFLEKTNCNLVCFDICSKMIHESKKRLEPKYSGRVCYLSELEKLSNYKFDIIYSMFFVMNHIINKEDLILVLTKINSCKNEKTSLFLDLYNHELMKNDPPKTYEKLNNDLSKKQCKVEKVNNFFNLKYSILDANSELTSKLHIKIKSWPNRIFHEKLNFNDYYYFNLQFDEVNNIGYQYILVGKNK